MFDTVKLSIIAIILFLFAGAYYYVSKLKEENIILEQNAKVLQESINGQQNVIDNLTVDVARQQKINVGLLNTIQSQQREIDGLNEKFKVKANGQSRDLGGIARAKPGLVNKIVNTATANANRCFELASGASLKQGETNSECKELIINLSN